MVADGAFFPSVREGSGNVSPRRLRGARCFWRGYPRVAPGAKLDLSLREARLRLYTLGLRSSPPYGRQGVHRWILRAAASWAARDDSFGGEEQKRQRQKQPQVLRLRWPLRDQLCSG